MLATARQTLSTLATAALLSLALAGTAHAGMPLCSATSVGKCQTSGANGTVIYGCGGGKFVAASCTTCDDACSNCVGSGMGCLNMSGEPEKKPIKKAPRRTRTPG